MKSIDFYLVDPQGLRHLRAQTRLHDDPTITISSCKLPSSLFLSYKATCIYQWCGTLLVRSIDINILLNIAAH